MQINLRHFQYKDMSLLDDWCRAIGAHQYMSNIHPGAFNHKDTGSSDDYVWYVIQRDGIDIGTIWLEKLPGEATCVKLGILIGYKQHFGKGIGRRVIGLAIQKAKSSFVFNRVVLHVRRTTTRAIRCYIRCGFKIVREFTKTKDDGQIIHAYRMEKEITI